MTLRYLPEHAESALQALDLARMEAAHLQYTYRTLFAQPIDAAWVQQLTTRDDMVHPDTKVLTAQVLLALADKVN